MNLHAIVRGAITAVNPDVTATIRKSTGATTLSTGGRVPTYDTYPIKAQVQALQYNDIAQLDSQNIQGVRRAVYMFGDMAGVVRAEQRGGDLLIFPDGLLPEGNTWLVAFMFEQWPGWCKACITLQNNG